MPENRELRGWGEISSYLKLSDRHAQRLEEEGLPIHRSSKLRHVVAYSDEIDAWRDLKEPSQDVLSEVVDGKPKQTEDRLDGPESEATDSTGPDKHQTATTPRRTRPSYLLLLFAFLGGGLSAFLLLQLKKPSPPSNREILSGTWEYSRDVWTGQSGEMVGRLDTGHLVGPGSEISVEIEPHGAAWSGGVEIFQDQTHWTFINLSPYSNSLTVWRYPAGTRTHFPSSHVRRDENVSLRVKLTKDRLELLIEDDAPIQVAREPADILSGHLFFRTGKQDDEWGDAEPGFASFSELNILSPLHETGWIIEPVTADERTDLDVVARIYNGDDQLDLLLDGQRVVSTGYREESFVQLTPYLRPGRHTLTLRVLNRRQGITYGVRLDHGGETIWHEVCGIAGERQDPCERLGSAVGLVDELSTSFEVP